MLSCPSSCITSGSGTHGESKRLEAVCVELVGDDAAAYEVYYRTHVQNIGWTGWAKDGQECELLPFGFRKFVRFNDQSLSQAINRRVFSSAEETKLRGMFETYLRRGGFPGVQSEAEARAVAVLQSYVQQVVAKDVIERHNLNNPQAVALFARRVVAANSRELSLRKAQNDFKSQGVTTNREFLSDLLGYFEDAFLVGTVKNYSLSLAENACSAAKVYVIDPGLAAANSLAQADDVGLRLEDAVYLELRRRFPDFRKGTISFLRTKQHSYEVDFVVGDALLQVNFALYQVCVSLEDEGTKNRELRALREAKVEAGLEEGFVFTLNEESTLTVEEGTIHVIPAWKWALQKE